MIKTTISLLAYAVLANCYFIQYTSFSIAVIKDVADLILTPYSTYGDYYFTYLFVLEHKFFREAYSRW
jgi:hypothetical protein